MRFVRPLFALAALCAAAACADGASRITAPEAPSRDVQAGGGLMGSGTASDGGWVGSGNAAPAPGDTTGRGGTWIGSGN